MWATSAPSPGWTSSTRSNNDTIRRRVLPAALGGPRHVPVTRQGLRRAAQRQQRRTGGQQRDTADHGPGQVERLPRCEYSCHTCCAADGSVGTETAASASFIGTLTSRVSASAPATYSSPAPARSPAARADRSPQASSAAPKSAIGVRKKAGKNTGLRTDAFIACMASIATCGSAASRPHIVEHTQA